MEPEDEHAFAATCYCARSCWEDPWADDMYGAWKKQIFNASSWFLLWKPAGAVRCELRDASIHWPAWDTCAAGEALLDYR